MTTLQEDFVDEVNAFIESTGMLPTIFGREAANDPNFVRNLKNGRSPSLAKADKVRTWMREHASGEAA